MQSFLDTFLAPPFPRNILSSSVASNGRLPASVTLPSFPFPPFSPSYPLIPPPNHPSFPLPPHPPLPFPTFCPQPILLSSTNLIFIPNPLVFTGFSGTLHIPLSSLLLFPSPLRLSQSIQLTSPLYSHFPPLQLTFEFSSHNSSQT